MDDMRPDEHVETAEFAPARVGGRRLPRLGPIVAGLWVVVLIGVVSLGILSHLGPAPDSSSIPSPMPAALRPMPSTYAIGPAQPGSGTPNRSGDPGQISLVIGAASRGITVTGAALPASVARLFISAESEDGDIESWRALSAKDGDFQPNQSPAFSIRLDVGLAPGQVMWLQANAYDAVGGKVGSVRQAFGTPAAHDPIRPKTFVLR